MRGNTCARCRTDLGISRRRRAAHARSPAGKGASSSSRLERDSSSSYTRSRRSPSLRMATGVIDEAQRLFDVSLAVACLCVVFPDEAAQRRTHFLVARRGEDAQRVVQRRLHAFGRTARQ